MMIRMFARPSAAVAALVAAVLLLPGCAAGPVFSNGAIEGWNAPLEPVRHAGRIATLPSGLRVVVYRFAGERQVLLRVTYAGGEETEPEGKPGVAVLAARLAERTSPGRGLATLVERRYAAGALTDVQATADEIIFTARLKPAYLREVMATESDRLEAPWAGLTEEAVAAEREWLAGVLEQAEGERSQQAAAIRRRALAGTRYGKPEPTPASLRALTLADVKAYLAATIAPERCVVVVSSGLDPLEVMKVVVDSLHGRAAVASGRAPYGAGRPAVTATPPRELATLVLPTGDRRLWLGWPVPGAAAGLEPAAVAVASLLEDALAARSARPDLEAQVKSVQVRTQLGDLASVLVAEVALGPGADAAAVRAELEREAAGLHDRPEALRGRRLLRSIRNTRYLANGGRAPVEEVARGVRVQQEPDPVRRFEVAAEEQLGLKLVDHLESWLAPHRAAAILVEPRPGQPTLPGEDVAAWEPETWAQGVDLVAMAAPGPEDVRKLVEPPGLDAAARERLPNGLEVVVLARGAEPFVHARLVLPGGAAAVDEVVRARHALALFGRRLPARGCRLVDAEVYADAALLRMSGPAAGQRFLLEAMACWTRDLVQEVKEPASREQERRYRRAKAEATLGAPPAAEDASADWYHRWLRRALTPAGGTLVITGAVDTGKTLAMARELFGGWTPAPGDVLPVRSSPPPAGRRAVILHTPKARQATATLAIRRAEPLATGEAIDDALAALLERDLTLRLMGGHVTVRVRPGGGPGWQHWRIRLEGAAERVGPATAIALGELERLSKGGIGLASADLARWDAARKAAFAWDGARPAGLWLGVQSVRGLPADAWERYPADLAAVDPAALHAALGQAAVGREGVLVLGDAAVVAPGLRDLGLAVEVLSDEGTAPAATP